MSEQSTPADPTATIARILVALDASPHSLSALKAAAELAALMHAELQGVYVEDINLVRLSGFDFLRVVGSYSAIMRPLDTRTVEREFRLQATKIRRSLAQTAMAANVPWTFRTARGTVSSELLAAAQEAGMMTMGRVGYSSGKRYGSTAETVLRQALRPVLILGEEGLAYPPIVLYDASPAAETGLQLARIMLLQRHEPLYLFMLPLPDESHASLESRTQLLVNRLEEDEVNVRAVMLEGNGDLVAVLDELDGGTLILPAKWADLLNRVKRTAIVVP